jgi:hypothetical protein
MVGITPFDCGRSRICPKLQSMARRNNFAIACTLALCAAASVIAQTAPVPTPNQFTQEKLAVWQQRLKLEHWKIAIEMKHLSDFPPKTLGGIRWDKSKKTAVIWVLDASDYQLPYRQMLDDMELTIVHELVHLDLASLPRGQASRSSEELAVEGIAQAMLGLDRKKD